MENRSVSFRQQLKGEVDDFLEEGSISCAHTAAAVAELVAALSHYTEEGQTLFPKVLVCDNRELALRLLQGREPIAVGSGPRNHETSRQALKQCAPLARGGWSIYIDRSDSELFTFGVFREPTSPTALDLRATISQLDTGDARIVLVHQIASRSVELVSPAGRSLQVHFSARSASSSRFDGIDRLAEIATEDFTHTHREAASSFLRGTLTESLRGGHGALVAVVPTSTKAPNSITHDSVVLNPPVDLGSLVSPHVEQQSSESLATLLAYRTLLAGMLACDGITVINTNLQVLGYNAFVRTPDSGANTPPREQLGGARRRAFLVLCELVKARELRAAYLRSSDGSDECKEAEK